MGMGYEYAGSASYPRFDEEVKKLVKLFGGIETAELKERKETEDQRFCGYWFGYASSAPDEMLKYIFPENTNPILVKWFNHIYDSLTPEETLIVFNELQHYVAEVNAISHQIYFEFERLTMYEEGWDIS